MFKHIDKYYWWQRANCNLSSVECWYLIALPWEIWTGEISITLSDILTYRTLFSVAAEPDMIIFSGLAISFSCLCSWNIIYDERLGLTWVVIIALLVCTLYTPLRCLNYNGTKPFNRNIFSLSMINSVYYILHLIAAPCVVKWRAHDTQIS